MKIILASASPRRKELIANICEKFEIITASTDETLPEGVHPREGVGMLAAKKGAAVREKMNKEGRAADEYVIVSADTLVEADGVALGKPEDREDAKRMLSLLSGRWHNVHTGIAVHYRERVLNEVASTAVLFRSLTDAEIEEYIDSGEPMDKAGSYAIQGLGGRFVEGYTGGFDVIVGLGLALTEKLIKRAMEDDEK